MGLFSMTKMVFRSVSRKPATLMYPVRPAKSAAAFRGRILIEPLKCIACRKCEKSCPTQAITVDVKVRTWQIDRLRCIICNCCVEDCPTNCLSTENIYTNPMTVREGIEIYTVPPKPERKKETVDNSKTEE